MKKKINSALNDLDERLIQEAAQADRLESGAPKVLKWALIPTGVAAAAGLCVFALANRPDGGVDLTESMAASSVPAAIVSEVTGDADNADNADNTEILPEVIELHAPSREYAEETCFGSEFPYIIYADENKILFTDIGCSIYLYYRNVDRIIYSANVYDALEECAGDRYKEFCAPSWNGISYGATVDGDALLMTVSLFHEPTNTYYNYKIDPEIGVMRRYDTLDEGYTKYEPDRPANNFLGADVVDVMPVSDSEYVALGIRGSFDLRGVEIREYEVSDIGVTLTNCIKPFIDEYFNNLEMENENLGVYELDEYAALRFDTASGAFTMTGWHIGNELLSGWYSVNGSELTLRCNSGQEYRFLISGDSVTAVSGEQEAELCSLIWEDGAAPENVNKLMFRFSYGRDVAETTAETGSYPQYDTDENNRTMAMTIRDYYSQNGIISDPDEAQKLLLSMSYPLDSSHTYVTTYNGYDQWRGGNHYGIDIGDDQIGGAEIFAPLPGTVIAASGDRSWNGGIGNYIIIDHGSGLSTVYAHCGEVNVTSGQSVSQGDVIGTVGASGWATGYHLHFEIREGGEVLSDDMNVFIGRFELTDYTAGSDITRQKYTESIYDPATAPQVTASLCCPVAEEYNVVTETPGSYYGHTGVDFRAEDIFGQDIYAAQGGEVVLAEWYFGYGNCIMIDHGSGVLTVYGHCDEINVTAGQTVAQGEVIGKVGKTGQATGDGLHFEIRVGDIPNFDAMSGFVERIGSKLSNTDGNTEQ